MSYLPTKKVHGARPAAVQEQLNKPKMIMCPSCDGQRVIEGIPCVDCKGTGQTTASQTYGETQ